MIEARAHDRKSGRRSIVRMTCEGKTQHVTNRIDRKRSLNIFDVGPRPERIGGESEGSARDRVSDCRKGPCPNGKIWNRIGRYAQIGAAVTSSA